MNTKQRSTKPILTDWHRQIKQKELVVINKKRLNKQFWVLKRGHNTDIAEEF